MLRAAVRQFLGTGTGPEADTKAAHQKAIEAFRRRLRALAQDSRYRHRWVALHGDIVLDSDEDEDALLRRVLDRDEEPIHIGYATDEPAPQKARFPGVRVRRQM